jgi:hypothetical protein
MIMRDELTTEQHHELLNNKEADDFSTYMAYLHAVELFGKEEALKYIGIKEPPQDPSE